MAGPHNQPGEINATSAASSLMDDDLPLVGTSRFKHPRWWVWPCDHSSTLRRQPAVTLHGQDEGYGMDALLPLRHRLSVLGTQARHPVLGYVVVMLSSATARWVGADAVCL